MSDSTYSRRIEIKSNYNIHWEKIPIKITVLAQYSCSIFIFLFILYRGIVKNLLLYMKFCTSLYKFSPNMVYHIFDYFKI